MRNRYQGDLNRLIRHPRPAAASRGLRSLGALNSAFATAKAPARTPAAPAYLKLVTLATGDDHFACIMDDGSLYVSGYYDFYGVMGDKPSGTDFISVACGQFQVAALKSDGTVVVWGDTDYGGAQGPVGDPVYGVGSVPAGLVAVDIACTSSTVAAINDAGEVVVWGTDSGSNEIANAPSGTGFVMISGSRYNYLALKDDGTVVAWGDDGPGAAGQNNVPVTLLPSVFVNSARAGSYALQNNGAFEYWGRDDQALGLPTMTDAIWIRCGQRSVHGVAVNQSGDLESFGWDAGGDGVLAGPAITNAAIADTMVSLQMCVKKDGAFVWWGSTSGLTAPPGSVKQPTFGWVN